MDHFFNKNYTKTDPLTVATDKARDYIKDAANAQKQVVDHTRKADRSPSVDFADMEVYVASLYQSIPIQRKASKVAQISFLCQLYMLIQRIGKNSPRFTRVSGLAAFTLFIDKVQAEGRRLIGQAQKTERVGLLVSKKVAVTETRRNFMEDGGKSHPHVGSCVKCGHKYVDLLPSNYLLHQKYMEELTEFTRLKEVLDNHQIDSSQFPAPRDKDNNVVKKLPRKPVVSQPLIRCHCLEMQWSAYSSTCPLDC